MLTYAESPSAESLPNEWRQKIVHANVKIQNVELSGCDLTSDQYERPKGYFILFGTDNKQKAEQVFSRISVNGNILLPLKKTFWSSFYGIVEDKFGISWKINGPA